MRGKVMQGSVKLLLGLLPVNVKETCGSARMEGALKDVKFAMEQNTVKTVAMKVFWNTTGVTGFPMILMHVQAGEVTGTSAAQLWQIFVSLQMLR